MGLKVATLTLLLVMLLACSKPHENPAPPGDNPPAAAPADDRPPPPLPPVVPAPLPAPLPKPTPKPPLPPVATTPGNTDPTGATAKCKDRTENGKHTSACSHHGGAADWLDNPPGDNETGVGPEQQHPTLPAAKPEAPPAVTESTVDKFLKQLPKGSAVFTAPGQADQYRPFDVTLRLENKELGAMIADARSRSPDEVSEGVSGIHMSDRMRAELIGDDFSPTGEKTVQEQPSSVQEGTTWKWQVHSDIPGKHKLIGRIETLMKIDGEDTWKEIDVAEVSVDIKINELGWAMNNWKWIATAIVLPLIGWFAKRKFTGTGKSKDQAAANPGE